MAESTPTGRAAAIAIATLAFGGIIAGVIIPNVVTQNHVEYGSWPDGASTSGRMCVTGSVWLTDDVRQLGRLPLVAEGGPPYCVYRACYDSGDPALAAFADASTPSGMDPLFAEDERPWVEGQPPLAVWCGGDEESEPMGCACRPRVMPALGTCEALVTPLDGAPTWVDAPANATLGRDQWRGNACLRAPCVVLAGHDYFPAACCVPQCNGRQCGPDGCGGSCGTCDATQASGTSEAGDWTSPTVCDGAAGRCCVEPPCTSERSPAPAGWLPPPPAPVEPPPVEPQP